MEQASKQVRRETSTADCTADQPSSSMVISWMMSSSLMKTSSSPSDPSPGSSPEILIAAAAVWGSHNCVCKAETTRQGGPSSQSGLVDAGDRGSRDQALGHRRTIGLQMAAGRPACTCRGDWAWGWSAAGYFSRFRSLVPRAHDPIRA